MNHFIKNSSGSPMLDFSHYINHEFQRIENESEYFRLELNDPRPRFEKLPFDDSVNESSDIAQ